MAAGRAPQGIVAIAELVGWESALKLSELAGGQTRRIPRSSPPEHWLHALIGADSAAKLCAMYGGDVLAIPKNSGESLAPRNALIRSDRQGGMTIRALATRYRLTERQVYNILGSVEE